MRALWLTMSGIAICLAGCSTALEPDQQARVEVAERAFAEAESPAEYLVVAGTYQQLIDDGLQSAAVFFNQGNAFMQAEKPGRAIACYRQALRLNPREAAIRANLQVAISQTGGSDPPEDLFCKVIFWQDWIGYTTKFYLATILLTGTSMLLVIGRVLANRSLRTCGMILLISSTIAVASTAYDWNRFERTRSGVVIVDTPAYRGNATSYDRAFSNQLGEGVEFVVTEERGNWLQISIPTVGTGWVPSENVVTY